MGVDFEIIGVDLEAQIRQTRPSSTGGQPSVARRRMAAVSVLRNVEPRKSNVDMAGMQTTVDG